MISLSKRASFSIKLLFVVIAAIYIAISIDWIAVWRSVSLNLIEAILISQVLFLSATCVIAFRHSILVRVPPAPFGNCLAAVLLSAGVNLVTPGRIAEVIKATYLRKVLKVPLANGTSAIAVERLFDVAAVSAIALAGFGGAVLENSQIFAAFLLLAFVGLLSIHKVAGLILRVTGKYEGRWVQFLRENCTHVITMLTKRRLGSVAGLTVTSWSLHFLAIWLFFALQSEVQLSLSQVALVFGAVLFAGAVPALPGGIGLIQVAVSMTLVAMDFPFSVALAQSIGLHIAEVLISAVSAPFLILLRPTGIRDLIGSISASRKEREAG
ncbi:lysylphosphatidylglycerol synthase transmembrane domain-containing protein [Pelagibius marinus]|uniref:lysylphosphatidylglycerol synthase transmembrane domain-containing protein n=1 Tax=Pelagibius marinus TaxID=2762760 RepID=UPI0018722EE2|nr:lysylphosphatidylglycerol synthase transmembrane domain-containing protein [Pelagibius marinus]